MHDMRRLFRYRWSSAALATALAVAGSLSLSACMAPIPPVSVTRFHRIDAAVAMPPGIYAIETTPGDGSAGLPPGGAYFSAAVARQMDLLGHRPMAATAGVVPDYRVVILVDRAVREGRGGGSGVNVGVGGATGSYGSGVGVGVGLDLTRLFGSGDGSMVATRMTVRIFAAGQNVALWEGRAETVAPASAPAAEPGLAADKLARAMFSGFPGNSGETISVP